MISKRPFLQRILRGCLCLIGMLVVLCVGAFLTLQLEGVQKRVLQYALQHVDPDLRLEMKGTHGLFPGRLKIDSLQLVRVTAGGGAEEVLAMESFSLKWNPLALIHRRVDVEMLTAQQVRVRAPSGTEEAPSSSWKDFKISEFLKAPTRERLPIEAVWHTFEIGRLELPSWPAVGISSEGEVHRDWRVNATLNVAPLEEGSPEGYVQWTLAPDATLTLDADLKLPPNDALSAALHWPEPSSIQLHLEGDGPVTAWVGTLRVDAGVRGAVMGRFHGDLEGLSLFKFTGAAKIGAWPEAMTWIGPEVTFNIEGTHPAQGGWTFNQTRILARDFNLYLNGQLTTEILDLRTHLIIENVAPYAVLFDLPMEGRINLDFDMRGSPARPSATFALNGRDWRYGEAQAGAVYVGGTLTPQADSLFKAHAALEGRIEGLKTADPEHFLTHAPETLTFTLKGLVDFLTPLVDWTLDVQGGAYRLKTKGVLTPDTKSWTGQGTLAREISRDTENIDEILLEATATGGWADEKKNSGLISI